MTEEITIQKSLTEQILDEMLSSLEGREEFEGQTIQQLKRLVASSGLTKVSSVAKAIKVISEQTS